MAENIIKPTPELRQQEHADNFKSVGEIIAQLVKKLGGGK
jgi:hypothetical protein